MTEITRVPLQKLAKGSRSKLWLGIVAAALAGGVLAVAAMPPLVAVKTIKAGTGPSPTPADMVLINYVGKLDNGVEFDKNKNAVVQMQGVVPGFAKALAQTQRGGKYLVHIPASLAYGEQASGAIPANSNLNFEIEVVDFRNRAQLEAQQRMMEQMMGQANAARQSAAGQAPSEARAAPQE